MSMMCRPMWPFLFMYGSHDMRHIGFPQVDGGQRDPREMGASHGIFGFSLFVFVNKALFCHFRLFFLGIYK